ncbi:MAG TPA: FHA domain-containing protein [Candidatus Thermoplasmatota archaeon]|nr:FHA domain-containing protein [Candidatus Thermoplasmatota archaeon]
MNRLRLLEMLQSPRAYAELTLPPSRGPGAGSARRFISRQALHQHLRPLLRLGLVEKVAGRDRPEPHYVVNRVRLYGALESLRRLARVRPEVEVPTPVSPVEPPFKVEPAVGPHLVLIRGADEGRVFPLRKPPEGGWVVGRPRDAGISLDYDPGVADQHARITLAGGKAEVVDLGTANGTWVNWRRIPPEAPRALAHGDVIGVGTSLLLYREA